jgi:hypothetical protein
MEGMNPKKQTLVHKTLSYTRSLLSTSKENSRKVY